MLSDYPGQDHNSVHHIQELINKYLTQDMGCKVVKMHQFTDGCAAQYKSRHCLGDLSCSLPDFDYLVQHNFFETAHAKGEQDAARLHIEQRRSKEMLQRTAIIQDAETMYTCMISYSRTFPIQQHQA